MALLYGITGRMPARVRTIVLVRCPACLNLNTSVVDKRDNADATTTRRRRRCASCGARFTTYERVERSALLVVKRDQRRQEFAGDKLRRSIELACTKRPISAETIARMVEQIEAELRAREVAEVSSSSIGDLVMQKLRKVDQVAYIRFASVYRAFADVSSFEDELQLLVDGPAGRAIAASGSAEASPLA